MAAPITNLILNPSALIDTSTTAVVAGTGGTAALVRTVVGAITDLVGGATLPATTRFTANWTVASTGPGGIEVTTAVGSITPGQYYYYAGYMRAAPNINMRASLVWKTSAGVTISTTNGTVNSILAPAGTAYQRLDVAGLAPATASYVVIQIYSVAAIPLGQVVALTAQLFRVVTLTGLRTQLVKNPDSSTTPIIQSSFGTSGVGTNGRVAGAGYLGTYAGQWTWTTAATAGASGHIWGGLESADDINVVAGTTVSAGIYAKPSIARSLGQGGLQARIEFFTSAGAAVGSVSLGTATAFVGNDMQRLKVENIVVPATATRARVGVHIPNHAGTTNGWTLQASAPIVEVGTTVGNYFNGDSANTTTNLRFWTTTANASPSIEGTIVGETYPFKFFDGNSDEVSVWNGAEGLSTSTIYFPVIVAVSDIPTGRVILTATDGPPTQIAYVIRRDTQGSTLVRETSTGVVVYDALGTFTVNDYEARQGLITNYLLTSASGIQVANTTITIPRWGTWLKNPGKPFMNMRVLWNSDNEYSRAARRELIPIRGAKFPIAHTDRRLAPSGTIKLATQTTSEAKAFTNLVDDGAVLMIDVNPDFGVPVRYVSVGDVVGRRAGKEDRDLTWEARIWELQIDETSAPIGIPAGQTVTYEAIPASFDSYISLAASVATYNDLAAGNWS
jgi:hypothetical protein